MDQITSYATLQSAVAGMCNRTGDTTVTDNVPLFIQLCEARMYDELVLKDMESDEALTITSGNNYVALPTGFISPIEFWLVLSGQRVRLTPCLPAELPYNTSASLPLYWAIDGANIRFDCPLSANTSAFLRCLKKSNLSGSVTTNYVLAQRPDIYLAGSLVELARFTRDQDLFNTWEPRFLAGCKAFKARDSRNHSIVPLRTDLGYRRRSNVLTGEA